VNRFECISIGSIGPSVDLETRLLLVTEYFAIEIFANVKLVNVCIVFQVNGHIVGFRF